MKHFKLKKGVLACLLSLALAFSCFSTVGIKAEEATTATAPAAVTAEYEWTSNSIVSSNATAYVYVLKAEKGNTIKAGTAANGQLASGKISLADLKVTKINKDAYFYVCDKEFETEGKSINANLVIKATSVKKAAGTIDYTQADDPESFTVLSATATDTSGKKIENPTVYWSTEANGTYYLATSEDTSTGNTRKYADNTNAKDGFDGKTLSDMLENGGVIYIKIAGVGGGTGSAQFASKAIKVKVAKQGKAPKVTVDVKKDTFSIKNGMDFALFTKSGEKYTIVDGWNTVLPQLKTAATKVLDDSVVKTSEFKPVDKKDASAGKTKAENENKVSYTSLKIKSLGYNKLNDVITSTSGYSTETEYYVGVRTSATSKKPASAVTYFKYSQKTQKPIVYTESCVSGEYLVASGTDFEKKGIVLNTIANYNGVNGTSGYDDSFKLETAGSGADTATASYEYAIVNAADLDSDTTSIDWTTVGWKKLDSKTKFTSKLKTKYSTVTGTTIKKVTAQLSATAKTATFNATEEVPADVKTVILVRRAGVKGKTADDAVVASDLIELYVMKDGKNYEIYSTKSVGEEAAKYTVNFYKYSESGEGTYAWVKDDSLTITGWGGGASATDELVTFPTVENADFFELNANCSAVSGDKLSESGQNTGKYVVAVNNGTAAVVKNIAVREYANIKVVAAASGEGTTDTKEIGAVKAGKVSSVSGDKLVAGTEVTAYVGTAIAEFEVLGYSAPDKYVLSGSGEIAAATGTGFSDATYNKDTNKVAVTVNTAEEIVLTVKYPVVKTYTVKFDLNGGTGTAPANKTTNSECKLAEIPDGTGLTAPETGKEFKGWGKTKEATDYVNTSTVFSADTTLYAIWGAANP